MVVLSQEAELQLIALIRHYEALDRRDAARNLLLAVEAAIARITSTPEAGLIAPRPYPALTRFGLRWIHERCYWFSYTPDTPPVMAGIFYEMADIPNRI